MARYIDADDFFQTLGFYEQSFDENRDFSARQTILQIMHELEHAPTADVVEVKQIEIIRADLKWWLKTNTEKGVVYIPKFVVENMVEKMNLSELPTD